MSWRERLDRLTERTFPLYGQVVLVTLIACAGALTCYFLTQRPDPPGPGTRVGPATVLSFLPDHVLFHRKAPVACAVLFAVGSVLWLGRRLVPLGVWLTALSFTAIVALYLESANQCTHVAHMTAMLLWLYAIWYHLLRREIRTADAAGQFWRTPLYPRWVHAASVFYVGLFYGFSGLGKVLESGLDWPNGTSLQLWTQLFSVDPQSFWSRMILSNKRIAVALQWLALLGELGGFVAIVSRTLRPIVGLMLVAFHIGQIAVFGWGFHANAAIIALVFFPVDEWIERRGQVPVH